MIEEHVYLISTYIAAIQSSYPSIYYIKLAATYLSARGQLIRRQLFEFNNRRPLASAPPHS